MYWKIEARYLIGNMKKESWSYLLCDYLPQKWEQFYHKYTGIDNQSASVQFLKTKSQPLNSALVLLVISVARLTQTRTNVELRTLLNYSQWFVTRDKFLEVIQKINKCLKSVELFLQTSNLCVKFKNKFT